MRRTSGWETILFVTEESQPWKWPPGTADEATILLGFLERQRALLEWKTSDLDAAGMQATFGASAITLGGLLKHLAHSEYHWFSTYLTGDEPQPPWEAPESWGRRLAHCNRRISRPTARTLAGFRRSLSFDDCAAGGQ